jgi:two-component system CheB/CheR fusion protein
MGKISATPDRREEHRPAKLESERVAEVPQDDSAWPADETPPPAVPGAFHGFVVGIGASAGGLDALERLFSTLPVDTGAAFVVIQHLSPDHKSMMDNLLARYTAMPVRVAEHDMPLAANSVFLIPPAKSMRLSGDRLLLSPKAEHGLSLPIDIFFNSLAEQCADRGIAVVLSGTGSDGSRGVPAVNAAGGFVFVQDPVNAKFDGMPRSAVGTGLADVVAPAEELAVALASHLRIPRSPGLRLLGGSASTAVTQPLEGILELLLASSGIDFRDYKSTTVLRRIERRMQVQRAPSLGAYLERLAETPDEQVVLRRELLIPVTRFFRDTDAFEHLAEHVIPALAQQTGVMEPIRVWVACCATGEEAYTLAILFAEAFRRLGTQRPVKIFATDVEGQYLEHAAAGVYSDAIAAEVSGERLERCFTQRQGHWVVRPEIRQMVIFARHNLVADPPFTRMDLVSCRNALIYFQPAAQERALRRLQYALAPGGHLLLGPSESLGVLHRDFSALPGRHKIYRLLRRDRLALSLDGPARHRSTPARTAAHGRTAATAGPLPAFKWVNQGQRQLLQAYTPPSMLIGPDRELLHVYGSARELLQITEGEASLDIVKLLPRELAWAAALLLQSVSKDDTPQRAAPVTVNSNGVSRHLRMVARRLAPPEAEAGADGEHPAPSLPASHTLMTLLSFEPLEALPVEHGDLAQLDDEQRLRVETLERELDLTNESLQSTIEELETANEELQATNEELMASNEELQSTNEELQSVNEELYTVNSEYQEKVDVLNSVNADLENIAKATAIPTVFLDEELRLQRFTPELNQLFKVRDGDRGRALEDFSTSLDYPELFSDLRRTLHERVATEREVRSRDGHWWLARIQPYGGGKGGTRAVVSFVNVTALKDSERMQAILDSLPEHLAVLDGHGTIVRVNDAWRRFAAANGDAELRHTGIGCNYLQVCGSVGGEDDDARAAHDGLRDVLAGRRERFTLQYPCASQGRTLWFLMHAAPVAHPGGGAVVSHIDITAWVQATTSATASADATGNAA